ncbi:hypothetical protein K9M42_03240 [Patescibacteria group bacterium]|nr:hypothetical protein [Patescibacteria group bacterium]
MKTEILNWCKEHKVITTIAVIMLLGVGYLSTIAENKNIVQNNNINENSEELEIDTNLNNIPQKSNTTYNIESLSNKINSTIGETYQMYRVNTDIKNEDKSYIILNFLNIKKYSTYNDFNNVIVLQTITNYIGTKKFLDEASYFELYDEFGNNTLDITSYIKDEKDFTEIVLEISEDINKYKYLKIGGIDKETNNNLNSLVFEIE